MKSFLLTSSYFSSLFLLSLCNNFSCDERKKKEMECENEKSFLKKGECYSEISGNKKGKLN